MQCGPQVLNKKTYSQSRRIKINIPVHDTMFNFYEEPRLMVVTLHGPPGPGVASHAREDFSNVSVHAPIPHLDVLTSFCLKQIAYHVHKNHIYLIFNKLMVRSACFQLIKSLQCVIMIGDKTPHTSFRSSPTGSARNEKRLNYL